MYCEEENFQEDLRNELSLSHYLTSTPFSNLNNANYSTHLSKEILR